MNLDTFHACREIITTSGYVMSSSRGNKQRPEVMAEKEAWRSFLAGCRFLHIDDSGAEEKRPMIGRPVCDRWTVQTGRHI